MKNFVFRYKIPVFIIVALALIIGAAVINNEYRLNSESLERTAVTPTQPASSWPSTNPDQDIEVVAENLDTPWEIEFIADSSGNENGEILLTERGGRFLKIGNDQRVYEIQGVKAAGEGGLLGLTKHPDFSTNHFIYLYYTTTNENQTENKVERYTFVNDELANRKIIIEGIAGATNHDGGRIAFGPDGLLYIATGDAQEEKLSQDTTSLNGKILRVKDDGGIPEDNPFGNAVYSYGHRNVQGLAWDKDGRLWATEHGRSGIRSGFDELNLIEKGLNYGWPEIAGDEFQEGMTAPVIHSGSSTTWAPSGMTYLNDSLFFAGLRGQGIYQAKLDGENVTTLIKHFDETYGRIRTVKLGPDGYLYILTNNTDGRGNPKENDDILIRINPRILE